jgi:hypothetical protein
MSAQILLIERLDSDGRRSSFSARCHAGVLRVGDVLTTAAGPDGSLRQIEVNCVEIRLSERVMVDQLEENYGGLVVLEGVDASTLSPEWTLSSA